MVIFLGSLYPQLLFNELKKRDQFVDYPANVFQHSLLKGLDEHISDLRVITSPVIKSRYGSVKDICDAMRFSHNGTDLLQDAYVGTIPVPGLQIVAEFWKVYRSLRKLLKETKQKNSLIVYALHTPFLLSAVLLRKRITCSCVVVLDLPEFMSHGNIVKRWAKKLDRSLINFCLKRLDCYALLSPYMRDKLPIKDKAWELVEGIYDGSKQLPKVEKCRERVILYTGSISKKYGILELLEAFKGIHNDNYRLWICGAGDGKENVIRCSGTDDRIKYFGILSHEEVLILQQKATVLINPRSSAGEYTKYSFPSKTMEYLASGTPTIMCHLPAIPKEYDEYLYYITDESVEGIRQKILEVCEKTQQVLDEYGQRASAFILNKKNAVIQSRKIVNMMQTVQRKV